MATDAPNGTHTDYAYESGNTLQRLIGVSNKASAGGAVLSQFSYGYGNTNAGTDGNGNATGFRDNRIGVSKQYGAVAGDAQTTSYGYSQTSMLTGESAPAKTADLPAVSNGYSFDAMGNRTQWSDGVAKTLTNAIYNRLNQLTDTATTLFKFSMNTLRFSYGLATLILCGGPALLAADAPPKPVAALPAPTLSIGQLAPPIDVWGAKGMRRHLADFRGKSMVLLTFFPKCFTGNCANQVISLRDAYPELQKMGVEVWAISTDSAEGERGQRAFAKHYKLPFALLPDADRKISMAYGAVQSKEQMAARMSVLVDKEGKVAWIDKQINPRTNGVDMVKRLKEEQSKGEKK